jgi:hypothetical protein
MHNLDNAQNISLSLVRNNKFSSLAHADGGNREVASHGISGGGGG